MDNSAESPARQYKRGYFNDWPVLDNHKKSLYNRVDYWIDTHRPGRPLMIAAETFMQGIGRTVRRPFRVVPFFDPAPWGGQWMKEVCDLDRRQANFGWCFDCVPEENSLLLRVDGELFEMPAQNLIYLRAQELLGAADRRRFGESFPIRFDFLDTIGGGNLSLQVHPTDEYIRRTFGMRYTQDESYYRCRARRLRLSRRETGRRSRRDARGAPHGPAGRRGVRCRAFREPLPGPQARPLPDSGRYGPLLGRRRHGP